MKSPLSLLYTKQSQFLHSLPITLLALHQLNCFSLNASSNSTSFVADTWILSLGIFKVRWFSKASFGKRIKVNGIQCTSTHSCPSNVQFSSYHSCSFYFLLLENHWILLTCKQFLNYKCLCLNVLMVWYYVLLYIEAMLLVKHGKYSIFSKWGRISDLSIYWGYSVHFGTVLVIVIELLVVHNTVITLRNKQLSG